MRIKEGAPWRHAGIRHATWRATVRATLAALAKAPLSAWFGITAISIFLAAVVCAPAIAPYGEADIVAGPFVPPNGRFLLGTDSVGRDMLSRLIYGVRNTVGVALAATCLSVVISIICAPLASAFGGWVDKALSGLADILTSIPQLIFALLLLTIAERSAGNLIVVIAFVDFPHFFCRVRAVAMDALATRYVEIARLRGEGLWWVIRKEILPNAMSPMATEFGLRFCIIFLLITALGFLGLGIQPPAADLGSMVRDNAALLGFNSLTALYPAAAVTVLTVAVRILVDWILPHTGGSET